MGAHDDAMNTSTGERLKALMAAKTSANAMRMAGQDATNLGDRQRVPLDLARQIVSEWPKAPRMTGEKLLEHYGAPDEATPTKLLWYRIGPWSRMELTADELVHNFPTPHTDFLTQYVLHPVPVERVADLVAFDGSVLIDRTRGEIGARCDHEAMNTLTLNLAVEIINGQRSVDDARRMYAETASAFMMGRGAPYAERLLFEPREGADQDEAIIGRPMAHQAVEKMKDAFGQGELPH
jgi:hypothetical protein